MSLKDTPHQERRSAPSKLYQDRTAAPRGRERRKKPRVVRNEKVRAVIPMSRLGGMANACLSRDETVKVMEDAIAGRLAGLQQPLYMSSTNGQVLSMFARNRRIRTLFEQVDVLSADGQPMVTISRYLSSRPLPERVATTDLFDDASRLLPEGTTYFMLGSTPDEIERAAAVVRRKYPRIRLVGYAHGYMDADSEEALLRRLEELRPDILWIGLGVPREQDFVSRNMGRLASVKVIKTSGGLFNFISGTNRRAPAWMQRLGLEWLYRTILEPRRLLWRYLTTNPHSLFLLLTRTR
ncbi:WecB/TagA/CpsF family glycosyltransferase [Mesorhizobium sp. CAU 1741]|uniref:WecB/TagA/CpsF family glycosyltransferase n=1 Tax=Mesorhizobium sp. CAU 1741 TaxID=3140366 RepID=UPI00325A8206